MLARGGEFSPGSGGARWDSMARISIFAHRFRGEERKKEKKTSSSRNFELRYDVHSCFLSKSGSFLSLVFFGDLKKKGLQNFFSGEKGLQKFFSGDLYLRKPKKGLSRFSARFVAFSNEILTVQK